MVVVFDIVEFNDMFNYVYIVFFVLGWLEKDGMVINLECCILC